MYIDLLLYPSSPSGCNRGVTSVYVLVSNITYSLTTTIHCIQVLKIAILAEKFAPDSEWYVNTMLNLIRWAGDYVSEEVWHRVIQVIINREDVQGYAAKTCFEVSHLYLLYVPCLPIAKYV